MKSFKDLTTLEQIETLKPFAEDVCREYGFENFTLESINHEFNSTFKITTLDGNRFALRININSERSLENVKAEIELTRYLSEDCNLKVAQPVSKPDGSYISCIWHPLLQKNLWAVVYRWIDGVEIGDTLELKALFKTGAAIARLHQATKDFELLPGASLHVISDFYWGGSNNIDSSSEINEIDRQVLQQEIERIQQITDGLFEVSTPQVIHADIHGWNVMWDGEDVTIFDFDDCAIGLPVQDLAVTLYYLDTPEQEREVLEGYKSISDLPIYSQEQMHALVLQRRIFLLNYLLASENPEHRDMVPKYLSKTLERIQKAP